jgi:hypothetical protein
LIKNKQPNDLIEMKLLKFYVLLFCFLLLNYDSFATYGCYLNSTGYVYTQKQGSKYKRSGSKTYAGLGACRMGASGGSCTVNSPNEVGVLGDYDITYCPLDGGYTWLLLLGTTLLSFNLIRKRIGFDVN